MSKTTILIVEDEAIVAADLAGKLGRLGYEIAGTAAAGEEAVAVASRLRPNLVLMDIWLEGPMDGIAAAEAIRSQIDLPVVFLTAHSDPATLARAKLTGPFGYILKPFEERELATQIEMAIYRHQADRELRQQREWLRVTLTSIGDAVIATDAGGRISFVNPVAEALTGWKADEAAGQPIQEVFRVVNEHSGEALEEPVARVLCEGRAVELANHAALMTKDGRKVPVEDSAAPILDAAGQVIGAVLVFHDVTEKRRAEQALRQSEERSRRFYESSLAGVYYWNTNGQITEANDKFLKMTGYEREDLVAGRIDWIRMTPPEFRELDERSVEELKATGANKTPFEKEYLR
jgi:PAS domain S-box-containing protein